VQCSYEDRGCSTKKDNINIQVHVTALSVDAFVSEWFDSANIRKLNLLERDENILIDGKQAKRVVIQCQFVHGISIVQKTYFIEGMCGLLYTASYTSNCGMPNDHLFEYMIRNTAVFPTYVQSQWQRFECDSPYIRIQYPALWSHEQVNYFFSPIQLLTRNRVKEQFAIVFDQTGSPDLMSDIIDAVKKKNSGVVVHYARRPCRISNVRALVTYLSHDFPEENHFKLQKLIYTVPAREKFKCWMFLYVSSCDLKSQDLWEHFLNSIDLGYEEPSDDEFAFWNNLYMRAKNEQFCDMLVRTADEPMRSESFAETYPTAASIAALSFAAGNIDANALKRTQSQSSLTGLLGMRSSSSAEFMFPGLDLESMSSSQNDNIDITSVTDMAQT